MRIRNPGKEMRLDGIVDVRRGAVRRAVSRLGFPARKQVGFSLALAWLLTLATSVQAQALSVSPLASAPVPEQLTFRVDRIRVEGNTLLSVDQVDAALAGSVGADRSLQDLTRAAARLQQAYRKAGYGGVLAFVPQQVLDGGTVLIRVVESRLAAVRVAGNRHYSSENIRSGLPGLREGITPRVVEIDRDIQFSNENPAKALKVTLLAGTRPGEVDAEVLVQDNNPLQFLLGLDNSGNAQTGHYRLGVGVLHANFSGHDDILNAQFQSSPGHADKVEVLGLGYRVPLYASATSLEVFYAHSDVSSGITPTLAGPLYFAGRGRVLGFRASRHLERLAGYDHRLGIGLDWRAYDNDCAFLSLGDLGSVACGSAGISTKVLPLILSYTGQAQSDRLTWGGNASVFANLGGSSSEVFNAARSGASRAFVKTRLTGFGELSLAHGFAVRGDLELQLSPHALLSGEQFGIGGAGSVRGYQERELAGDYGHALRLEVKGPAVEASDWRVRPHLFIDQGRVSKHRGGVCGAEGAVSCSIGSVGLGLRLSRSPTASASIEWGRARKTGVQTSSSDSRIHAMFQYAF